MKSKTIKITVTLSFLVVQFFSLSSFAFAQTAGSVTFSAVNVSSKNVTDGQTITVTPIISNWSNVFSTGDTVKTFVNGKQVGNITGVSLSSLKSGSQYQSITVSTANGFQTGQNYINVDIIGADGTNYGNQNAPVVTYTSSSANGGGPTTCTTDSACANAGTGPNGWNYICSNQGTQGTCVEDINLPAGSHCVPNQSVGDDCANNAACDSTTNTCVVSEYGCQAGDGTWTCKPDQSLQATCGSNFGQVSPAAKCGCTDAAFSAGTCSNSKTKAGTTATAPTVAASANSGTTLFNPLPEGDLVHVFLLVAQGFLAILGILAVVFIVVGGFEMVIAAGNEEMYLKAKKTIIWAILGLVVATLSFSIIAIVEDFLGVTIPTQTTNGPTGATQPTTNGPTGTTQPPAGSTGITPPQ